MDPGRKYPFRIYYWLVRDEVTGKVQKTRWRMTEEDAARFPDAVRIEDDSLLITGPCELAPADHQVSYKPKASSTDHP